MGARDGGLRCPGATRSQSIKAPSVLDMLVVLTWVEDHPLLPRLLPKLSIRVPRPQQGACWKDCFAALCALVRQPVSDALHEITTPDAQIFVVVPSGFL